MAWWEKRVQSTTNVSPIDTTNTNTWWSKRYNPNLDTAPQPVLQPQSIQQQPVVQPQQVQQPTQNLWQKITSPIANLFKTPQQEPQVKTAEQMSPIIKAGEKLQNALEKYMPQTYAKIEHIISDPLSKNGDIKQAVIDGWEGYKETVKDEVMRLYEANKAPKIGETSFTDWATKKVSATTGFVGTVFAPLNILFSAAENTPKIGGLIELMMLPFTALGESAPKVTDKIIDSLPLKVDTKSQLKPAVGEVFALATQVAFGKATTEMAMKQSKYVRQFGVDNFNKLTKDIQTKYSPPKTVTIDKATVRQFYIDDAKLAPEVRRAMIDLKLSGSEIKNAVNNGLSINVPWEKVVTIKDKPYWEKAKSIFNVPKTDVTLTETKTQPTKGVAGMLEGGKGDIVPTPAKLPVETGSKTIINAPTIKPTGELPKVFTENTGKYVNVKDFADSIVGSKPTDQVGTLDPNGIVARDPIDPKYVSDLTEKIKAGNVEGIEPVILERGDGGKLQTFDGSNRLTAYKNAGVAVPVIYRGSDAIEGLKRIEEIYKEPPKKVVDTSDTMVQEKAVSDGETKLREAYKAKEDNVYEEMGKIFEEMSISEAGQRIFLEDGGVIGIKSTFPDWIPEELRRKELFDKVLGGLVDINKLSYPAGNKTAQRDLYDAILSEIDSRVGLDTSVIRGSIIKAYENQATIRATSKTKSTLGESTKGSKEKVAFNKPTHIRKNGAISGTADIGGYSTIESAKKSVENIKSVEFPELLRMAKDLVGSVPSLKKFPRALGMFYSKGGGAIKLSPEIFKDPKLASRVLAHEMGHLADYLPNKSLDRGNLLGRIASLKNFLKGTFGVNEIKNKVIREELKKLSQLWKPFDEKNTAFAKYRYSSRELYADAISVLFNDPALLKTEAPTFYNSFFEFLDKKPTFSKDFFELQDLLNNGSDAVMARRNAEIDKMFNTGEEKFTARELEKQKKKTSLLFNAQILFDDKNQAVINQLKKVKKLGGVVSDAENPIYALEELNYMDSSIRNRIGKYFQTSFEKVQKIDNGWNELGKVLFFERVINERGELANPQGYDPKTAKDQLTYLERTINPEDWRILQEAKADFRNGVQSVISEAEKAEYYSPEMIKQMKANPAYATFQVLDYLDTYISPAIHKSVGTLKDVSNVATSTVMKSISTLKAIERNNAKKILVDFELKHFPQDIKPAKTKFTGKHQEVIDSRDPNFETVKLMQAGKLVGYDVDPYIALTVNNMTNDTVTKLSKVLRTVSGASFYRPLFTSVNLGFQTFNAVRDFQRYWKSIPDKTALDAVKSFFVAGKQYALAAKPAWHRAVGKQNEIIKAMEDLKILGLTYNDLGRAFDPEDTQIERSLNKVGIKFGNEKNVPKIIKPVVKVLDGVEILGNFIETLPKVAGYKQLKGTMPEKELASFIRTKAGSPSFRRVGSATQITNPVFLFSNAIKEGIKTDIQIAIDPKTRAGYWWKTFLSGMLPKILMAVVASGYFGKGVQRIMNNASEYDKTNYTIIPLGEDEDGRGIYLRLPQDESGRLFSGIFWKALNMAKRGELKLKDIAEIFSFGAGQFPNVSPSFTGIGATIEYLSGRNPYDSFRGRNIIPDKEFKAGFKYSFPIFVKWLAQNQGLGIIVPNYTPQNEELTTLQKILGLPVLSNIAGRWVKVSDYGKTEKYREVTKEVETKKAKESLEEDKKIQDAYKTYKKSDKSDATYTAIANNLIEDVIGQKADTLNKEQTTEANAILKKLNRAIIKGKADPEVNALISATSNDAKAELLIPILSSMPKEDVAEFLDEMLKDKIITSDVLLKYSELSINGK